jgi:peptidyl-prolyl cis-trans isomerase SurA
MLRLIALSLISLLITGQAFSQLRASDDAVVAQIGNQQIQLGELISYYSLNSLDESPNADQLKEFLPFYIDYKLKLTEAQSQNLDQDEELITEYNNYARQASLSYWLENEVKERLFTEFKERSEYELKAFHILHRLDPNASPADTARVYNLLMQARDDFESGESIENLDSKYSTQMQGRSMGGQLPWFSAGSTVKPFEDALYAAEMGQLTYPVRTQFGYHLIYVQEKRPKSADRSISHIFFPASEGEAGAESAKEAHLALQRGQTWIDVVNEYSRDTASAQRGGNIGWVNYGMQFSEDFVEIVMNLSTELQFSEPVSTIYGMHILRVDSVKTYPDEESKLSELRTQLENLPHYQADRQNVIDQAARVGNAHLNRENLNNLFNALNANISLRVSEIDIPDRVLSQELFSVHNHKYSNLDFWNWLSIRFQDYRPNQLDNSLINDFTNELIEQHLAEITVSEFPEFSEQLQQFKDGLMVFKLSDLNIWSSESVDTTALINLYNENLQNYKLGDRFHYILIGARNDSLLQKSLELKRNGVIRDSIRSQIPGIVIVEDSVSATTEEPYVLLSSLEPGEYSEPFEYRNRFAVFQLVSNLPARQMTYDEAFFRLVSDYQPVREEKYTNSLREKYRVRTWPNRIR